MDIYSGNKILEVNVKPDHIKFKKDPKKLIELFNDIFRENGYYLKHPNTEYLKNFKAISNKKISELVKKID